MVHVLGLAPPTKFLWQFTDRLQQLARVRDALKESNAFTEALLNGERARAFEHLDAMRDTLEVGPTVTPRDVQSVAPEAPEFTVDGFLQRGGLHLWWAVPSAGKTYVALGLVHQLLSTTSATLFDHPSLTIRAGFRENGSPHGVTLIGNLFDEGTICNVGMAMEAKLGVWDTRPEMG